MEVNIALKSVVLSIDTKYGVIINKTINLNDLEKKLKQENAALTAFFYGNNAIYQFEFSSNQHKFLKIELNAELTKTITDFIHLFDNASVINNNVNAFTSQAFELYSF